MCACVCVCFSLNSNYIYAVCEQFLKHEEWITSYSSTLKHQSSVQQPQKGSTSIITGIKVVFPFSQTEIKIAIMTAFCSTEFKPKVGLFKICFNAFLLYKNNRQVLAVSQDISVLGGICNTLSANDLQRWHPKYQNGIFNSESWYFDKYISLIENT